MRKSYIIMLAALLAVGCAKDNVDTSVPADGEDGISFRASLDADGTRTSYQDGPDALVVNWYAGDKIGVFANCGESSVARNLPFQALGGGKESDFEWTMKKLRWADETSAHDFYSYYPYDAQRGDDFNAVNINIPAVQYKGGTPFAHITSMDFMYSATTGVVRSDAAVKLSFKHALAIVNVNLQCNYTVDVQNLTLRLKDTDEALAAENAKIDLATGKIDFTGAKTSSEITYVGPELIVSGTGGNIYVVVTPGHAGKTIEVVGQVGGKEYTLATKTVPAEGFQSGKMYVIKGTLTVDESEAKVIEDLSENETANCYIVNKPATSYKFRANVAGNGKLPTVLSSNGLSTELDATSARLLRTWVASGGYKNGTADGSDPTMSRLVERSSVCLKVENGTPYIFFDTPDEETFAAGNAVICAMDDSGNIVWSWHIWVTPDYELGQGDFTAMANEKCETAVFMDRNLGALSNGTDAGYTALQNAQAACGLLYQWGRKDPLCGVGVGTDYQPMGNYQTAAGEILRTKGVYNFETAENSNSYEARRTYVDESYNLAASIKEIAAHPEYFYTPFGNKGGQSYGEYWATVFAPRSMDAIVNPIWGNPGGNKRDLFSGSKTAFDPCPAGYRVPDVNALGFIVRGGTLPLNISVLIGGDLNAMNIDYSKTPWNVADNKINADATRGIYVYTGSELSAGQTDAERVNTATTFIPMFGRWWYSTGDADKAVSTVLLTTVYSTNGPGLTIYTRSTNAALNSNIVSLGSDGGHSECAPVRCMRVRPGQYGDPNQIDDRNNKIDDFGKWNSWSE